MDNSPTNSLALPSLALFTQPLPLPNVPGGPKLTRSQGFFSLMTKIDIQSLSIGKGEDFFAFMDLHEEKK